MTEYKCGSAKSCKYGNMCKPNFNIGACSHYKAEEPLTNEEWLKQCTTEQLAEWMVMLQLVGVYPIKRGSIDTEMFISDTVEWLKQPHTESSSNP